MVEKRGIMREALLRGVVDEREAVAAVVVSATTDKREKIGQGRGYHTAVLRSDGGGGGDGRCAICVC